jgi:hypothetical protein
LEYCKGGSLGAYIPIPFLKFIADKDEEAIKDIVQSCNENLSRAFFDKNGCKEFWRVTEIMINRINKNPKESVLDIYNALEQGVTASYLTRDTLLYMISLVKSGSENVN